MKYNKMEWGTMEAVVNKLGGMEGVQRFLAGELEVRGVEEKLPCFLNWQAVGKELGMEKEFAELMEQFEQASRGQWAIYVPKGLTRNKVWQTLKRLCGGYSVYGDNLDAEISKINDRDPSKDGYAIAVRATVEADEENANKSADQLEEECHRGKTFLERELLELAYYLTTGQHLDVENWTLCAGSRHRAGSVPCVRWRAGRREVGVYGYGPDDSSGDFRSRSVVSLPAKTRASVAQRA